MKTSKKNTGDFMKDNFEVVNMIVSGKVNLKKRISRKDQSNMIMKCGWHLPREDEIMISKQFDYRKKIELNVHKKKKDPFVTIWCSGAFVIVGLRSKKEARDIYDLLIKDLKKGGIKIK